MSDTDGAILRGFRGMDRYPRLRPSALPGEIVAGSRSNNFKDVQSEEAMASM